MEVVLEDNLDPNDWKEVDSKKLKTNISQKRAQLKFLRSATIKDLINEPQLTLDNTFLRSKAIQDLIHESKLTLDDNKPNQTFDSITRQILSDGLAYQLITSGYLNRNFTLYTSTFHGKAISANAQNFIIHNVEPNIMDEQLPLEESDVKAIINECDNQVLGEPCLYNISILNYLLNHDPNKADIMIQSLIQFGDEELRFLQAYLNGENGHNELIKKLTPQTENALIFLINKIELDNELKLVLVSTALERLNSDLDYKLDDTEHEYLQAHYADLPALINTTNKVQAENIAKLYANAVIRVPELQPLSKEIRNAFIAKDLYDINVDNLKIAIENDTNLALDVALKKNKRIYDYLLLNLEKYLSAVIGSSKTVSSNEYFIRVVEDVLALKNADGLDCIIINASDDCIINSLDDVQKDAWQCLADSNRFTATFDNINSYIATFGKIDKSLEKVLTENDAISECKSATESESEHETKKETLAVHILNADSLAAKQRAQLVKSLNLDNSIHTKDLLKEEGELFPLLLDKKIIEDGADTYKHLLTTDWSTRERYIEVSNQFHEYITPELLHGDLAAFLASKKIELDTKISVVERAEEFTVDCSKNDLIELTKFAINQDKTLSLDVIEKMVSNGVEDQSILKLLRSHLDEISLNQLTDLLSFMKGDYPKLTVADGSILKMPNNEENIKLLTILQQHEIVSTFPPISDQLLKVNMKGKGKKNN